MDPKTDVAMPAAKVGASIGTAAVVKAEDIANATHNAFIAADMFTLSWSNIAAAMAAIYTLSMLGEFWWKKFWRPLFERKGWIKEKPRLVLTEAEIHAIERRRERERVETTL
jgi:N-glycosylase/DNA lyase